MKIYIRPNEYYSSIVLYTLKLIEVNTKNTFHYCESTNECSLIWDHEHPNTQPIAPHFYNELKQTNSTYNQSFLENKCITTKDGKKDAIATIFYMVNCVQEYNPCSTTLDQYGRFKYDFSYQAKHNEIDQNHVQNEIDALCKQWDIKAEKEKSTFFISHDIDTIYGSFLQDGFWAIKNMKIGVILNLIMWELSRKPHWKNMDKIIKLNSEHDIRTTFFWLVNKGVGEQNIKNADYDIVKEQKLIKLVNDANFTNGLHKSSSQMELDEELHKGKLDTTYNRYHFLKFLPHSDWTKISNSKIDFDCSLGFAEHYGFRNSYGKAFQPYDIINEKPFDFVEAPLHFMDGTFHSYMKVKTDTIADTIIDFYEKNPTNCDLSLLWHNTYFTDYKYNSFIKEYKKVTEYIYENKIHCVTPNELIVNNRLTW